MSTKLTMSDWPWEVDKTNLLNRKAYLEDNISTDWRAFQFHHVD
jgi:hypothetical protein